MFDVTTAVIIQARMNSTRLPGKVMLDLAGKTVLEHVLDRCKSILDIDAVCCAIPFGAENDVIADIVLKSGAVVVRGDELDVLGRYWNAARYLGADTILRVTSDCPMIDPDVCSRIINILGTSRADFACNHLPRSWPHGLDCAAFNFDWLDRAFREAKSSEEREHVVRFIRLHPDAKVVNLIGPEGPHSTWRWTLDTLNDYKFLVAMFERLPSGPAGYSWQAAKKVIDEAPWLLEINT